MAYWKRLTDRDGKLVDVNLDTRLELASPSRCGKANDPTDPGGRKRRAVIAASCTTK
jgi:hypothetical protein